jgi:hypothetical protein
MQQSDYGTNLSRRNQPDRSSTLRVNSHLLPQELAGKERVPLGSGRSSLRVRWNTPGHKNRGDAEARFLLSLPWPPPLCLFLHNPYSDQSAPECIWLSAFGHPCPHVQPGSLEATETLVTLAHWHPILYNDSGQSFLRTACAYLSPPQLIINS